MENFSGGKNTSVVETLRDSVATQLSAAENEDFSMVFSNCMIEIAESLTATGIFIWVILKDTDGNDVSRPYIDYSPHKGLMTMATHPELVYRFDPENNPQDKALINNEIRIKSSDEFSEGETAAYDDNVHAITLIPIFFDQEKMWGYMGILYSDYAFIPAQVDLPILRNISMILASSITNYSASKAKTTQTNAPEVQTKSEHSKSLLGTHILVVDDAEINRDIITYILEEEGAEISQAEDGAEALALFEASPHAYNLIITDIHMPNMNGYDAAMNIRAIAPPNSEYVPIVSMSAEHGETVLSYEGSAYIDANLHKPIDPQRLLAVVKTLLNH
jgi:CheY-like chemotaxis protein